MTPKQKFQIFSPLFACLLSWTHTWHIFLQSPCMYSNDMTPISRNLKKHLFSFIFKIYFVCLLGCFPYFLKFSLFVCLLSSFLPFFLPPVKRTIIFVNFFSNFQGFTLVPWQKVGRIGLFFPLPVFQRYDTKAKISYFSSLIWCVITIIFHSGSSKRNFWCKEHSCSSKKIVKVSNFPPVLTGFLLSFFPCIRTI